jgi:hypothetical protein
MMLSLLFFFVRSTKALVVVSSALTTLPRKGPC